MIIPYNPEKPLSRLNAILYKLGEWYDFEWSIDGVMAPVLKYTSKRDASFTGSVRLNRIDIEDYNAGQEIDSIERLIQCLSREVKLDDIL